MSSATSSAVPAELWSYAAAVRGDAEELHARVGPLAAAIAAAPVAPDWWRSTPEVIEDLTAHIHRVREHAGLVDDVGHAFARAGAGGPLAKSASGTVVV